MSDGAVRRARPFGASAATLATALALAFAVFFTACGGDDDGSTVAAERAADAEILNDVLSRQLAAVDAQHAVAWKLLDRDRQLALQFRGQEQQHVDAIVKALRGHGAESEPEPEEIDTGELHSRLDRLSFLYELEGATIAAELNAISKLAAPWPRALLGSIVANQAQHRLVLRERLGLSGAEPVPNPFEDGTEPATKG